MSRIEVRTETPRNYHVTLMLQMTGEQALIVFAKQLHVFGLVGRKGVSVNLKGERHLPPCNHQSPPKPSHPSTYIQVRAPMWFRRFRWD